MDAILEAVKESHLYRDYIKQKAVLDQFPELKENVIRLRQITEQMQNVTDPGEEDALNEEYDRLISDVRVHDFMQAELDYCRMFQSLQSEMAKELEL